MYLLILLSALACMLLQNTGMKAMFKTVKVFQGKF